MGTLHIHTDQRRRRGGRARSPPSLRPRQLSLVGRMGVPVQNSARGAPVGSLRGPGASPPATQQLHNNYITIYFNVKSKETASLNQTKTTGSLLLKIAEARFLQIRMVK